MSEGGFNRRTVHAAFTQPRGPAVLPQTMQATLERKRAAQMEVPWEHLRTRAHAIKAYAIHNLDRLLVQFEGEFVRRGGTVLWARTADEAAALFLDICATHNAKSVVKGKSMVSEELCLNERLDKAGIDSVETDLGEFIIQLAGQKPSHIIAPAWHLSRAEIGRIFAEKLGIAYTDDPQALMHEARIRLRARYLRAEVGVTGVNFAIAETGTIVTVENEGNGALSAGTPPVHVALMGIEKVIPRFEDLEVFLLLLSRAATGQKITTYTHHFLGPESGKKAYCILVDAGRTELLADPKTRESLYCIRCGACLSVCPIYRRVGGWAYGGVYSGPIGAVVTPPMIGLRDAGELPFASTLCGACKDECPINIDLPHQLVHLRGKATPQPGVASAAERQTVRFWARAMSTSRGYARFSKLARAGGTLVRLSPWKPGPIGAWAAKRALPDIPIESFKEWWKRQR